MKTIYNDRYEGDFLEGMHLTGMNCLLDGSIVKVTEKAVLIETLNGKAVNPYSEIWIPKSAINFLNSTTFNAENGCESNSISVNVTLENWIITKNRGLLTRGRF